jgi:hypothetical protein
MGTCSEIDGDHLVLNSGKVCEQLYAVRMAGQGEAVNTDWLGHGLFPWILMFQVGKGTLC